MKKMFLGLLKGIDVVVKGLLAILITIIALVFFIPLRILFPTKIIGRKNLSHVKGCKIVASNHFSNLDIILLLVFFYPIAFTRKVLGKIELTKCKLFGYILASYGGIFIDRSKLDVKAMKCITSELQKGKTVIIFPEGTRNKDGSEDTKSVKGGVAYFAYKADATIVPIVILHRPKIFKFNKIIVSEGYKISQEQKLNSEQEIERLNAVYKDVREKYTKTPKGE